MARSVNINKKFLQKGIQWYEIQDAAKPADLTHVLRIDVQNAQPFVLGSLLGKTKKSYGGNIKSIQKRQLASISQNAQKGVRDISIPISSKTKRLKPLWITNGTFFCDDCASNWIWLSGSILDSTVPVGYKGPLPKPPLLIDPPAPSMGGPTNSDGESKIFKDEFR